MKYILILVFIFFGFIKSGYGSSVASSSDSISNDVYGVVADEHDNSYGYYVKRFDSYTLGTSNSYVFNDGGGTATTEGWIKTRGMTSRSLCFDITGIGDAVTITVGIFGGNGTPTPTIAMTYSETVYSGTSSADIVNGSKADWNRIGVKRSGTSSGSLTIYESYSREQR